jgi:diacylglycerol kinase (ATP)
MPNNFMKIITASGYALTGLKKAVSRERAFRQEMVVFVAAVAIALVISGSLAELALLILPWGLVLIVELLNSAVEAAIDRIGPEQHPLSGDAKDFGAAAVLISIVCAVAVWAGFLFLKFI